MTAITPYQAYRKARACYVAGDLNGAGKICRLIMASAPEYVDAAYLLAIIAHREGRHGEGDRLLQQAVVNQGYSIRLEGSPPSSARHAKTPHTRLEALLLRDAGRYVEVLRSFARWLPQLQEITPAAAAGGAPHWNNPWIPPLDGIALYGMVAVKRPRLYVEVGSGNSTKFVRRAIADHGLATKVVSIDPQPRADIDPLCDVVIRKPLEESDLSPFSDLVAGDLIFIDSSHRCFMNSDVTVFFTEILPNLPRGVTVGIHDIFLPYDYPADWEARYYSEQYLLACYLLAGGARFDIVLPAYFTTRHAPAQDALSALRNGLPGALPMEGASFWIEMK